MKDVFQDLLLPDKPILILGKGQSLDDYKESMMEDYYVIGINQVGEVVPVDITFIIHSEHTTSLPMILPYYPHVGKKPGPLSTYEHGYHYNLNTSNKVHGSSPVISQDGFTIHALLNVLGLKGVLTIRTLGVDGKFGYSNLIDQVSSCNFDQQFPETKKLIDRYKFDFKPLKESSAIEPKTWDAHVNVGYKEEIWH